jgi:hypothetical protein
MSVTEIERVGKSGYNKPQALKLVSRLRAGWQSTARLLGTRFGRTPSVMFPQTLRCRSLRSANVGLTAEYPTAQAAAWSAVSGSPRSIRTFSTDAIASFATISGDSDAIQDLSTMVSSAELRPNSNCVQAFWKFWAQLWMAQSPRIYALHYLVFSVLG